MEEPQNAADGTLKILWFTFVFLVVISFPGIYVALSYPDRGSYSAEMAGLLLKTAAVGLFLFYMIRKRPVRLGLTKPLSGAFVGTAFFFAIASILLSAVISPLWGSLFQRSAENYQEAMSTARYPLFMFIDVCIFAPIAEEVVLRGYALPNFTRKYGASIGLLLTTLLFALLHLNLYQMSWALISGYFLGLLYQRSDSVIYPILLHYIFNLVGLLAGLAVR